MHSSTQVGKFLVTPTIKRIDGGLYAASVSIRRGMHDRVFRLIPRFTDDVRATRYALALGRQLVHRNQLA